MVRSSDARVATELRAAGIAVRSRPALAEPRSRPSFNKTNGAVQRLEILQHHQEMFQVASDSIDCPAHDNLDPRSTGIKKK